MDGFCDECGEVFVDGVDVVNLSFSTWDEADGRMTDGWDREDFIVHAGKCLTTMVWVARQNIT